jgi:uncharacterized heparinase superfamily protein
MWADVPSPDRRWKQLAGVHGPGVYILSSATWKDRLRILGLFAGLAARPMRKALALPLRAAAILRAPAPERLLIAPQDIRTGDPTIAAEIVAGYFAFGGKIVNAHGLSPFALEPGSNAWAMQLNGFGWLRHLRAAEDPRLKAQARVLVDEFLKVSARPAAGPVWEPQVAARRMIAWLSQSPIILDGSDRAFYVRFMEALGTTRLHLERCFTEGLDGEPRLLAAIALAEFGLCAPASGSFQRKSTNLLASEIAAQILADGGHVSRDPQCLIDLLLDLLPLRQAYAARGIPVPAPVLNAIDRMMPMLRLFRHGDGTLALFNGMSLTAPELVATILAYDDARAQPLTNAPYSGYQRLDAGSAILITDSGTIPPPAFASRAHAGCLSFEFSHGLQRIIVNCGDPEISRANIREFARATAAHSTLVIDDTSSSKFAIHTGLGTWLGDQILSGPSKVTAERLHGDGFTTLRLSHNGYESRFGFIHSRELSLANDGELLEGRDALEDSGRRVPDGLPYVLRFHLHPSIEASLAGEDTAAILDLPDGDRWLFQADAAIALEPSILFAAGGGPRHTTQIVIASNSAGQTVIHWALRKRPAEPAGDRPGPANEAPANTSPGDPASPR